VTRQNPNSFTENEKAWPEFALEVTVVRCTDHLCRAEGYGGNAKNWWPAGSFRRSPSERDFFPER